MIYRNIVQRSPEWFEMRLGAVTCSRLGDIMPGVKGKYLASRETYMEELAAEILTGNMANFFVNDAMQHGIDTEPLARAAYEAYEGVFVEEVGLCTHPTIEGFLGSPDGLVGDDSSIEIKCPNSNTHIKTKSSGKVKKQYEWQMYGVMICAERKTCTFISYDPRLPVTASYYSKLYTLTPEIKSEIEENVIIFQKELLELVGALSNEKL